MRVCLSSKYFEATVDRTYYSFIQFSELRIKILNFVFDTINQPHKGASSSVLAHMGKQ